MVYFFGLDPLLATSYSLFIVGLTSLVGASFSYRLGHVNVKTAWYFGLSSILTVFLIRHFIIPIIPKSLGIVGTFELTFDWLTMVLFAILMSFAAFAMIRSDKKATAAEPKERPQQVVRLLVYGVGIGLTTGFLGAGGGFLLIPALVLMLGMPMKEAVGTSLLIIAANSLIGFTGDLDHITIDWLFLGKVTGIAIVGIILGGYLKQLVPVNRLRKSFGWFILLIGIFIVIKQIAV